MSSVLVLGSLAYDYIMNFDGRFREHILPDKIHILNVSFLANKLSREFGGTAGNISYNLSLLNEFPKIIASAGKDFDDYKNWLIKNKIDISDVKILKNQFTASAHIITDRDDNQITAFYGGAMESNVFSIKNILNRQNFKLAICAPDCKDGMILHIREIKEKGIDYIFDPGQTLTQLNGGELKEMIDRSKGAIFNDYEIQLFLDKTKLSIDKVKSLTEYLIITKGPEGSLIYYKNKEYKIPPAKPKNESDPTGAGDAYRAGIIKGILKGLSPDIIGRLGSVCAVYTVEKYGTQTHLFSREEFIKRYEDNFGREKKLKILFE